MAVQKNTPIIFKELMLLKKYTSLFFIAIERNSMPLI